MQLNCTNLYKNKTINRPKIDKLLALTYVIMRPLRIKYLLNKRYTGSRNQPSYHSNQCQLCKSTNQAFKTTLYIKIQNSIIFMQKHP